MVALLAFLACTRPAPSPEVAAAPTQADEAIAAPKVSSTARDPTTVEASTHATARDVLALFRALPDEALPDSIFGDGDREAVLARPSETLAPGEEYEGHLQVLDSSKGYLRFYRHGDGDTQTAEFLLLSADADPALLAVHAIGGPSCGNVSRLRLYRYDGGWTDLSETAWPTLDASALGADAQDMNVEPEWEVQLTPGSREVKVSLSACTEFADPDRGERLLAHLLTLRLIGERFEIVGHARP